MGEGEVEGKWVFIDLFKIRDIGGQIWCSPLLVFSPTTISSYSIDY